MNTRINRSDIILMSIYYSISMLLEMREYYIRKNDLIEFLVDIPSLLIISIILVGIFAFWLIPEFIIKDKKYIQFTVLGLLILIFFGAILYIIGFWTAGNPWSKLPNLESFILNSINDGTEALGFPLGLFLTKKFYESQTEISSIQQKQKENELKLLRSQIDPHFLFNNLNTLDSLIDSDAEKAKEYINRLSLIYRYLIQTKDAEVMELSDEIKFAENYIFLIKTRFGNDYDFNVKENISLTNKFIPTGAIQTLLENVVKHNKAQFNKPIKTTISINDGWLIITNSKSEIINKSASLGTGLHNLKARYKLLSDKQIQINNMDKKFEVFIPIINLTDEN